MVSGFDFDPNNDPSHETRPGVPEALRQGPAAKVQEELHQGNAQDLRTSGPATIRHGDPLRPLRVLFPKWLWINTYKNTIFRGMNIHLPAILMFTRGTRF